MAKIVEYEIMEKRLKKRTKLEKMKMKNENRSIEARLDVRA